jgi:hypothetical protein
MPDTDATKQFSKDYTTGEYVFEFSSMGMIKGVKPTETTEDDYVWNMPISGTVGRTCWVELHSNRDGKFVFTTVQCETPCATVETKRVSNASKFYDEKLLSQIPTLQVVTLHTESICGKLYISRSEMFPREINPGRVTTIKKDGAQMKVFMQDWVIPLSRDTKAFKMFEGSASIGVSYAVVDNGIVNMENQVQPQATETKDKKTEEDRIVIPEVATGVVKSIIPQVKRNTDDFLSYDHDTFSANNTFWWIYLVITVGCLALMAFIIYMIQRNEKQKPQ